MLVGFMWGRWYLPIPRQHDIVSLGGHPIKGTGPGTSCVSDPDENQNLHDQRHTLKALTHMLVGFVWDRRDLPTPRQREIIISIGGHPIKGTAPGMSCM